MDHQCDQLCICPVHLTPFFYSRRWQQHACQRIDCEYGHGYEMARMNEIIGTIEQEMDRDA